MRVVDANWSAPAGVRACFTTRDGGVSVAPYASLNLGARCGDDAAAVADNRRRAQRRAGGRSIHWLRQVHGRKVHYASGQAGVEEPEADAAWTDQRDMALAILAADCLPIALASRDGRRLGVAHAGWRGLGRGVIEALWSAMGLRSGEAVACLGPAICGQCFEVGPEVRDAFLAQRAGDAACFKPGAGDRWYADLHGLAAARLRDLGAIVSARALCTVEQSHDFFSYRRDRITGRQALLAWLE